MKRVSPALGRKCTKQSTKKDSLLSKQKMNKLCICLKSVNFMFLGERSAFILLYSFAVGGGGGGGTVKIWIRYAVVLFFGGGGEIWPYVILRVAGNPGFSFLNL